MLDFEKKVSDYITAHGLPQPAVARVFVALSGGADSVALLAVLTALGYDCVALHCNFHLRGAESDRDERHACSVARRVGVTVEVNHFDVERFKASHRGVSTEMACRELRYRWFDEMLDGCPGAVLAIGHNSGDNVETFMLNALRGSGLKGLTGMLGMRGRYMRPLLGCSREEITGYLSTRDIGYVTDSSNLANDYRRNVVRNELLPLAGRYFTGAADGIGRTMECLAGNMEIFQAKVDEAREMYVDASGNIDLSMLLTHERCGRQLLFELLNDGRYRNFNMSVVDDIVASARRSGLLFSNSAGDTYLLDRGRLLKTDKTGDTSGCHSVDISSTVNGPLAIDVSVIDRRDFNPRRDSARAYFDVDILDGNPRFEMRRWREGDRMRPFGMKGSRLLSDMFSDAKLSAVDKRQLWVLTREDDIIWIPGMRASGLFPVTDSTRRVLCLTLREPTD